MSTPSDGRQAVGLVRPGITGDNKGEGDKKLLALLYRTMGAHAYRSLPWLLARSKTFRGLDEKPNMLVRRQDESGDRHVVTRRVFYDCSALEWA